jgi:hypothetical protein
MIVPSERRTYPRLSACLRVQLLHANHPGDEFWVINVSEGGALLADEHRSLSVGETLHLRVLGLLRDKAVPVPVRIVRRCVLGVGVNFMH